MTLHASVLMEVDFYDRSGSTASSGGSFVRASDWQPSTRYSDRPISLGTRLFGMSGVGIVVLIIVGGALFTWTTIHTAKSAASLSVFDVAPPAAPPEP